MPDNKQQSFQQLSFHVTAKFTFTNGDTTTLDTAIERIRIFVDLKTLVPKMLMRFNINASYSNHLLFPYTVDLTIVEKDERDKDKSRIKATFQSISSTTKTTVLANNSFEQHSNTIRVSHKYALKDAYTFANSTVGGVYNNTSIADLLKKLFRKTQHGTLGLNIGSLDNKEKLEQVWVPNLRFSTALSYLSQHYGFYKNVPFIFTDLNNLNIKSLSEMNRDIEPVTVHIQPTPGGESKVNIDDKIYLTNSQPLFSSNINMMLTTIPKKMSVLSHDDDAFYSQNDVDTIKQLKSLDIGSNSVYEQNLEKNVKPKTHVISPNNNMFTFQESFSNMLANTSSSPVIKIHAPFRFGDWNVGGKLTLKTESSVYKGLESDTYISSLTYDIYQQSTGNWNGCINVSINNKSFRFVKE